MLGGDACESGERAEVVLVVGRLAVGQFCGVPAGDALGQGGLGQV